MKIVAFLVSVLVLAPVINHPIKVQAEDNPVNLVLGGTGATSWNINNVNPGDSGNITVTLHNDGTVDGFVTIWLSDLISIVGPKGSPGKFGNYLLLNVDVPGLETNLQLPAVVSGFPQSASSPNYIKVSPLLKNQTITLIWKWALPFQTGNDVQGNGVSFSVNYMLEELPPPPPLAGGGGGGGGTIPSPPGTTTTTVTHDLQVVLEGEKLAIRVSADGTVQETSRIADRTETFLVDIGQGTKITADGKVPDRIELTQDTENLDELAGIPQNTVALSLVYKLTAYSGDVPLPGINFDPYVIITISYDPKDLPDNTFPPYIITFDDAGNFERLSPPVGSLQELGKVVAVAYHASYFAVVAEAAPPPPPLPAHFQVSNLVITPGLANTGQPVYISADISNDGQLSGSYEVHLVIDGIVRGIKEITVAQKSITTVTFEVTDLAAGEHRVNIAGLNGSFRIASIAVSPPVGTQVDWPLIDLIVGAILVAGLIVTFLAVRRSQQAERS